MSFRDRYHLLRFFDWSRLNAALIALQCPSLTYETVVAAMWKAKEDLR